MVRTIFFTSGVTLAAVGAVVPLVLPSLPSSVQTAPGLSQVGSFIINQQSWIVLVGLVLILLGLFL